MTLTIYHTCEIANSGGIEYLCGAIGPDPIGTK